MRRRPITWLLVLCALSVCLGTVGAMYCRNRDGSCSRAFGNVQGVLCSVACAVVVLALCFAEFSIGGSAAGRNY